MVDWRKAYNRVLQKKVYFEGQEGGRRKLPYAFTEQGIYMLATVLTGELAEKKSIFILHKKLPLNLFDACQINGIINIEFI